MRRKAGGRPARPDVGVRKIKYATDGHHSWTPEEIAQYRERHPPGSKARLALDLLPYTGGRREDAVRLGPQHVRNGRLRFRQAKNEHRNPIDIDIPLHRELKTSIAATPSSGHMTLLVTPHEIAAVTGHMSLEEIERYTRAARKKKLADAAIAGTPVGTIAAPGASQLPQNGAPVTPPPTSVFGSSPSC
jgi:integrase/recombinase XerD